MRSSAVQSQTWDVISRIGAGVAGGYVFVWGFIALGCSLGVAAGMKFDEARTLTYLLAFLVYLAVFCWAFAETSLRRVWVALAGGGALMTGAGWLLGRALT